MIPSEGLETRVTVNSSPIQTSLPETSVAEATHRFVAASPVSTHVFPANQTQTASAQNQLVPCNLAVAGIPLDVTIPDDSRLEPNASFSKVWRLVNNGSCTWTADYAVVWFSGDDLGANRFVPVISAVQPGETVEIVVDMIAPDEPGLYSGYWMLKSDTGELFGIGPNGDSPFWVRIQVMAVTVVEPTETSTPVPTTAVLVTGTANLAIGDSIDLDSGKLNPAAKADGMLEQLAEDQLQWMPLNDGRFGIFGISKPGELECRLATLSEDPILITMLEKGIYLCYRTGDGLPGLMQIENLPAGESPLEIDFTTWAVP